MFFHRPPKSYLDLRCEGVSMSKKNTFFLVILLVANPFMLLFFQNCSASSHVKAESASEEFTKADLKTEISYKVDRNLVIK